MRRDLRYKPQIEMVGTFSNIDIFNAIPMGKDHWDEADLLSPLKYLMSSTKLRWEMGRMLTCKDHLLNIWPTYPHPHLEDA